MKLLFFVTVDWYFCSHRLPVAMAAREAGYEVVVVTQVLEYGQQIRDAGLRVISLDCSRRSTNPFSELAVVARLAAIYRRERPDIVHHVAVKPVLYGSLAARLVGVPHVVNALTGMGWLFASRSVTARVLKTPFRVALRYLLGRGKVIVQNSEDAFLVRSLGDPDVHVIQGSGVDACQFRPTPEPEGAPVVMLVARLLWDKGVGEFVAAARLLSEWGTKARFVLVGEPDPENRSSVGEATLKQWEAEGVVEWWGYRKHMPAVLAQAHIACLPSYYREGIPKSLIEAAACGLPIVTTDTPGCREIAVDGENGLLVPPRDPMALAAALQRLVTSPELRRRMGRRGRAMVLERFVEDHVVEATLNVYRELLPPPDGGARVVSRGR